MECYSSEACYNPFNEDLSDGPYDDEEDLEQELNCEDDSFNAEGFDSNGWWD
jgi:hypothetical protein